MAEGFTCKVGEVNTDYLFACRDLPEYKAGYCILHDPGEEKKADLEQSLESILESKARQNEYDFSGTVFPEGTADFSNYQFDANVNFAGAAFVNAIFLFAEFKGETTDFSGAEFSSKKGTYFSSAEFGSKKGTYFSFAKFSGERTDFSRGEQLERYRLESTDLTGAIFSSEMTDFQRAKFFSEGGTSFQEAKFAQSVKVNFRDATFGERVAFWGSTANSVFDTEAWADFHGSRVEKPEQLIFNTVLLHPGWFLNADVRKVDFTDVKWYGMPNRPPVNPQEKELLKKLSEGTLEKELSNLEEHHVESPHALPSQACQRLSANAEENHEYPLANKFYYWSMDALRKEGWRGFGPIRTLYWALSGYGVRARRAFLVLVGIWAAFTILYILVPSSPFSGLSLSNFGEAIVYSLGAMARLNPEPRPGPGFFQFLVTVEGLLGPLQIGLLLLAIRRQVMR